MVGGGLGHHLPLLFSRLAQLPLVVAVQMSHRGCRVAATTMAIPALASGQACPSPARGVCMSGEAPGSGGRAGMMSFGAISVASAMVVCVNLTSRGERSLTTPAYQGRLALVFLPLGAAVNKIKSATLTLPNA